jgi:Mg2+/Co2+ transporter CorB
MLFGEEVVRISDSSANNKWEKLSDMKFITVRHMIMIMLILETIIQIPCIWLAPSLGLELFTPTWWLLQFAGVVMATNIGAVVLAIIAQDAANKIGTSQSEAFTVEFMQGIETLTQIMTTLETTASQRGENLSNQITELIPLYYDLGLSYVRTHTTPSVQPPVIKVLPPADYESEEELFD